MGKIVQEQFSNCLKTAVNNYNQIKKDYEKQFSESLNGEPYESINNHSMKECKYRISILISSWNCANTLLYTLKSIENTYIVQNFNNKVEVIVVDDGSTDETATIIKNEKFNYKLKYVKQKHMGRAQGINMAFKHSTGDILIFCDADIILFPFTIDELVKRQQEYLDDAIFFGFREDIEKVCPISGLNGYIYNKKPLFWKDNRFTPDVLGSYCSNMMAETNMLMNFACMQNIWVSNGKESMYDCWQLYRMVYGFLFSVSRKNYEKVGGFSEFLVGWGCDDTSFVAQAIERGVKVIPVPSAHVLHIKHPIRMKSQWEDGKRNEKRMNDYLSQQTRINYLNMDFTSRIITKFEKAPCINPKKTQKYKVGFQNSLEQADYYYYLGNFKKSYKKYRINCKHLTIMQQENYYDTLIRLNKKSEFNKLGFNNKSFFYILGNYYFNHEKLKINKESKSIYIKYLYKVSDHLKRANEYFHEKQYYLSYVDFFANYLKNNTKAKLEQCEKEVKEKFN